MELIEISNAIEETKANYELAKSKEEALYYKAILQDLRNEKQQILKKEFNRSC